jgi:hypothetical protein
VGNSIRLIAKHVADSLRMASLHLDQSVTRDSLTHRTLAIGLVRLPWSINSISKVTTPGMSSHGACIRIGSSVPDVRRYTRNETRYPQPSTAYLASPINPNQGNTYKTTQQPSCLQAPYILISFPIDSCYILSRHRNAPPHTPPAPRQSEHHARISLLNYPRCDPHNYRERSTNQRQQHQQLPSRSSQSGGEARVRVQ